MNSSEPTVARLLESYMCVCIHYSLGNYKVELELEFIGLARLGLSQDVELP